MKKIYTICAASILLLLSACGFLGKRVDTNYYVLDYLPSTERADLKLKVSNGKVLHVLNTNVNRTYNRNQLVEKESFNRVNFLNNEMWANRLNDDVANIISRRLRAYNIFGSVSRTLGDTDPDYYLEANIQNIEKIKGDPPRAFLRMDFILRDSTNDSVVLMHRNERYQELYDDSYVYLVQTYNSMIMEETNLFAALCIAHFSGRPISRQRPDYLESLSAPEKYYFEEIANIESHLVYGELVLRTQYPTSNTIGYKVERLDSLNTKISDDIGEYNIPMILLPGRYRVITGHNADIVEVVDVHPRQRTVVSRVWSELKVRIMDTSQNRVRQSYKLWLQNENENGYQNIGQDLSLGDDEHGIDDRIWILPNGKYMLTLGGNSWSDLRDFATISLNKGESQILTVIVNTDLSGSNILVGAGVLSDDFGFDATRLHKGAVHINLNVTSNNKIDQKTPTYSLILSSKFDNTIDSDFRPFHYNMRSSYDLRSIFSKDIDLRFDRDNYSLKNTLTLYPWKRDRNILGKFALYSRADLSTHFMDEYTYFSAKKNYILQDTNGVETARAMDQDKLRTKIALYPLRLKEGTGLTYRFALSPTTDLTLRGGYGWQQDFNRLSYSSPVSINENGVAYDVYQEGADKHSNGLESTLIFSAGNILNFVSINSIFEVLFPLENNEIRPRFENENKINFRIYRNISMDVDLNLSYDKSVNKWLVYDYSSFLRLSLFY